MTRYMLAICITLPLAVLVGCGDPSDDCQNADCGDDDTVTTDQFEATLRSVAPYGWIGDHRVRDAEDKDVNECEDVSKCDSDVADYGNFELSLWGDTFACVPQIQLVTVNDDGSTINVTSPWTGEGICFLTPEGEYSGLDVRTVIGNANGFDQGWIHVGSWDAVITGGYFFHDGVFFLEGTVSDDLSSIEYTAISESGNEFGGTIYLED